jgi:histidyl-tRNA synthetase
MYTFEDRGGDSLTLRPEFTAGIARAYLSNGWQQHAPLKLATHGPAFRYERPQKGRFRQFHQIDAEIIGTDSPQADVELLVMADQLLKELGITEGVTLQLNTLGDAETRDAWRAALVAHFEAHRADLSEESLARLAKNPLRILDSKDPRDRPTADTAPGIDDFMTASAQNFFAAVTAGLDAAGVAWTRNARLVRGLDYYRHTAFEFVTDRLGAQGTVLGGGRYDGLMESLGGAPTPAVGWAAGIERLAMLMPPPGDGQQTLVIVPDNAAIADEAYRIAHHLRKGGLGTVFDSPRVEIAFKGNAKKRVEQAKRQGYEAILFVRDTENQRDALHLTHVSGDQSTAMNLLMKVLAYVPEPYTAISGDGPET